MKLPYILIIITFMKNTIWKTIKTKAKGQGTLVILDPNSSNQTHKYFSPEESKKIDDFKKEINNIELFDGNYSVAKDFFAPDLNWGGHLFKKWEEINIMYWMILKPASEKDENIYWAHPNFFNNDCLVNLD